MIRTALTGGIATGKSYCVARFAALGVPIIDADTLARDAVAPGSPGLDAVGRRFGSAVFLPDGGLDRAALARIIFYDRTARADLEAIIHPEVYRRVRDWFVRLPLTTRLAIADIPLVFETGHNHEFDAVIVVACHPATQVDRLMARSSLSREEARARIAAQWPIQEKVARADYVIRTDGSFEDTDAQIQGIFESLSAEL